MAGVRSVWADRLELCCPGCGLLHWVTPAVAVEAVGGLGGGREGVQTVALRCRHCSLWWQMTPDIHVYLAVSREGDLIFSPEPFLAAAAFPGRGIQPAPSQAGQAPATPTAAAGVDQASVAPRTSTLAAFQAPPLSATPPAVGFAGQAAPAPATPTDATEAGKASVAPGTPPPAAFAGQQPPAAATPTAAACAGPAGGTPTAAPSMCRE